MIKFLTLTIATFLLALSVQAQDTSELQIKSGEVLHQFNVEIADTPELITTGLMNRDTMAEDAGMLFDFDITGDRSMWMKSTPLPLDILFLNETGKVMAIARKAVPHSERRIGVGAPVRAVLELNADRAKQLGIEPGDTVIHAVFSNTDLGEAAPE